MRLTYRIYSGVIAAASLATVRTSEALAQGVRAGVEAARGNDQPTDLFMQGGIFQEIVNVLLFLIGAIAVIMIIIGGFRYVVSGGNASNVTAAKNTILYAIVGIIVALLAYAAVNFVVTTFTTGGMTGGGTNSGL